MVDTAPQTCYPSGHLCITGNLSPNGAYLTGSTVNYSRSTDQCVHTCISEEAKANQ